MEKIAAFLLLKEQLSERDLGALFKKDLGALFKQLELSGSNERIC